LRPKLCQLRQERCSKSKQELPILYSGFQKSWPSSGTKERELKIEFVKHSPVTFRWRRVAARESHSAGGAALGGSMRAIDRWTHQLQQPRFCSVGARRRWAICCAFSVAGGRLAELHETATRRVEQRWAASCAL